MGNIISLVTGGCGFIGSHIVDCLLEEGHTVRIIDNFTTGRPENLEHQEGNGRSVAIASHMTEDFMKNGGMNIYSLNDNSVITCMGNDYGYEYIFPAH